ncbi:hypothetical protein QR680_008260 [Steinernema hermaphroditum]|uniref:Uncharacterized protein n=1 Tax=Steinernema hermaphroditum TaxID=289476 RepID=A0AA39IHD9_9BILA|nr:hypothetical protein QR680_008260 [Steinernema hermaphroditum]
MLFSVMMIVAVFNIALFVLFFPTTLLMIWIIVTTKELWKHWAYKIIVNIGVADLRILISDAFCGLIYLMNIEVSETTARVGYLMFTGIIELEVLFFVVLAFNRLFVILQIKSLDKGVVYVMALATIWFTNIGVIVYLNSLHSMAFYDRKTLGVYLKAISETQSYDQIKLIISYSCFGIATVCYTVTVISLCLKRNSMSTQEINILIQAIVPFLLAACARTVQKFQSEISAVFGERVGDFLYNFFYRAMPALHLIVYVLFNRTIRRHLLRIVKLKEPSTVHVPRGPSIHTVSLVLSATSGRKE